MSGIKLRGATAIAICTIVAAGCAPMGPRGFVFVDVDRAHELLSRRSLIGIGSRSAVLVDPRGEERFASAHIPGAINLPFTSDSVKPRILAGYDILIVYGGDYNDPIAEATSKWLMQHGHKDVRILRGGLRGWTSEGYEVMTATGDVGVLLRNYIQAIRHRGNRVSATDSLFHNIEREGLLSAKYQAYQDYWIHSLRPRVATRSFALSFDHFKQNLLRAATNDRCTVTFRTPKRDGATIKYNKSVDRERVAMSTLSEPTFVTEELERARYDFQCWRTNDETGEWIMTSELSNVACTADVKTVVFNE